ncbi:DALR anticodon-binding domain-containing protein, partial [Streptomyces sp. 12297]
DPTPDNAPDDAPTPLSLAIAPAARRDDDAFARVGVADVVWLMLATPLKETPKLPAGPLAQDESNPCFLVRYAHSRARAAVRDAARLGYTPDRVPDRVHDDPSLDPVHDRGAPAPALLAALAEYPLVLEAAAHHRAPERLARHLVTVADALVDCSYDALPKGDEKPSAAHRSRLALVEAAGTVLAGGLSLLGIDAPDTL